MRRLETARLSLVALTLEAVDLALAGDVLALGALLDAEVPPSWPDETLRERALPVVRRRLSLDPEADVWGSWAMLHDGVLVGSVALKGPPDHAGRVEIGYGVLPAWRRRGLATEAVVALVGWARDRPDVRRIIARCDPDNIASVRVLETVGMAPAGTADGLLLWELRA